jgi:hypothetical protein
MRVLAAVFGIIIILIILGDAFETIVFPRRVTRRVRLARLFYRYTWLPWSRFVRRFSSGKRAEILLSFYGPLSLLLLLVVWVTGLLFGFAFLHWADGSALRGAGENPGFGTDLYMSATTLFTLGLGDVAPRTSTARAVTAIEVAVGLGFLALIVGYFPVLNQSFSRREVNISLLDSRGGSPPTAGEMIRRHLPDPGLTSLQQLLSEWERWSAELLESHLSYPVLAYYRSQHDNQSWLGALTAILDTCAFLMSGVEGSCRRQAELTFAMARHAVVDLAIIFKRPPQNPEFDRLPPADLQHLRMILNEGGLAVQGGSAAEQRLSELRAMYEPYLNSLSRYLIFPLPPWIPHPGSSDNWQTSPWARPSERGETGELRRRMGGDHF